MATCLMMLLGSDVGCPGRPLHHCTPIFSCMAQEAAPCSTWHIQREGKTTDNSMSTTKMEWTRRKPPQACCMQGGVHCKHTAADMPHAACGMLCMTMNLHLLQIDMRQRLQAVCGHWCGLQEGAAARSCSAATVISRHT